MPDPIAGYERLGFTSDPFSHTEAEVELKLLDYYVKPPYFAEVLGNPENQKSWVVFGDFGRGKSALRAQIYAELKNDKADKVVCVSYDEFTALVEAKPFDQTTLMDHMDQIMIRFVLAFLALVAKRKSDIKLNKVQRECAQWFTQRYFETLSRAEADIYLDSVSTMDDKTRKIIREQKGAIINLIVNVGLGYIGLPGFKVDVSQDHAWDGVPAENPLLLMQRLYDLFSVFGVRSLIVLVDRVDQSRKEMSDPVNLIKFLSPLLWNYNLLSLNEAGVNRQILGFKFFLPFEAQTLDHLQKQNFRFDRVIPKTVAWTDSLLATIWRKRLAYFSDNRILDLAVVCEDKDVDRAILSRAKGTPRRMLIMGQLILSEYNNLEEKPRIVPRACVTAALRNFEATFN